MNKTIFKSHKMYKIRGMNNGNLTLIKANTFLMGNFYFFSFCFLLTLCIVIMFKINELIIVIVSLFSPQTFLIIGSKYQLINVNIKCVLYCYKVEIKINLNLNIKNAFSS